MPGVGEEALKDEAHQWRPLAREGALCVSSAWGLHPDFPPHLLTLSQPGVPQGCRSGSGFSVLLQPLPHLLVPVAAGRAPSSSPQGHVKTEFNKPGLERGELTAQ